MSAQATSSASAPHNKKQRSQKDSKVQTVAQSANTLRKQQQKSGKKNDANKKETFKLAVESPFQLKW